MNRFISGQQIDSDRTPTGLFEKRDRFFVIAGLALSGALPSGFAYAYQDTSGDWAMSLDTTVSYGVSYRAAGQDNKLIAKANGGSGANAATINSDDSDLNFRKGDVFSEVVKVLSEMDLKFQDKYGVFVRGRAFYDFKLEDDELRHRQLSDGGKKQAGSSVELLDAFVYGSWDLSEHEVSARVGRQVINWGEGLFYQNGIAATNPVDLSALRAPGSELKEAFTPTAMAFGSLHLSENLTLEGYWQPGWAWEKTQLDPCGTYFAGDVLGKGCDYLVVPQLQEAFTGGKAFDSPSDVAGLNPILATTFVPRGHDIDADSADQYGLALRWYLPELNETEVGLYYLRYSTQTPLLGASVGSSLAPGVPNASSSRYYAEYLENRDLFGASFNTTIGGDSIFSGQSLFGELSYRPNAAIATDSGITLSNALFNPDGLPKGTRIDGYREKKMYQASLGTIRSMVGVLGAGSSNIIAEAVASHISGLDSGGEFGAVTSSAYGATVTMSLTYNNLFDAIDLVPTISHGRTFNGVSPLGTNGLNEEAWSTSFGINAIYQNSFSVGAQYVNFSGSDNGARDKDFISFNAKYSF
ncbi:DUF1302 domain-containing protein [Pseudomonas fluorescens]|uniref:DUF1302 domain-containing protein n=1 Tax=Pseudomonas fluorescens TaxID=294 RepID=A0A0F4V7V9_PSEFL|nr:DUF1302 domain-containing protein [Pseudomonas fluorescens]KJZ64585.1 hypothetical protein VD17_17065 [Pseudomonas fluorescens]